MVVVLCGGTNDRFGRLHVDMLPRLQRTIELVAATTANHKQVQVLTSGGLNDTLHLGIARGPGPALTRPHWALVGNALVESGLPKATLVDKGLPALTTVDEAIMTREYLASQPWQSLGQPRKVVVVTSLYHKARVKHLFSRALAPCAGVHGVALRVVGVPDGRIAPSSTNISMLDAQAHT